ncbi:SMC-Scp complex subunit ScpB [Nitrosomonas sp. Is24]|uniref:SMC-Scp complex subunit ScpB n=1 Tax=Nitrosomonas sp. Is24 TaxID=3080533 RepID=UPI00294B32FD|nr:SMC-Scp complex subunit ScpB [Nitrosomonas sp. Is24]MDV6340234.1 SMC-Scp complex subunit ScpB [Nitrosomonas sp. Is24]
MSVQSMPPEYSQPEVQDSLSPAKTRQILEVALLTTQEPLPVSELRKLFNNELSAAVLANLLEEIREQWRDSGIELVTVASGWRFQTKAEMQPYLERLTPQKAPRYSRAILETLAIIAYRQPVTRGDIEEIRGVGVSSSILKTLVARGWIEAVGHRNVPGKPELFATTAHFLDDLNLRSIEELPPLEEMKSLLESGSENEHLPLEQPEASGH